MIKIHIKSDCDKSSNDVFKTFASAIIKQDFNCSNVCNPLWLEPILNTIDHGLDNCVEPTDYYCMYSEDTLNLIVPLAPATLKVNTYFDPKHQVNFDSKGALTHLKS